MLAIICLKCWRQMLAIVISEMVAIIISRNAGNKCYQLQLFEIPAIKISDKYYQLENPEMVATNVSNYNCKEC